MIYRKKLIEVALPLEAINAASAREKSIRHGHPSTLHLWWARRPLAAARAVIFAQMVDDPSAHPDLFPTEKAQEKERKRLFKIIEDLVKWENTTNEEVLQRARDAIWQSWRYTCAENADHPRARELFDRYRLPAFHDPFAGGGALPLEAQRLGLEAYASDLNPVAVLINKAMIEIPPRFAGRPPVNPGESSEERGVRSEGAGRSNASHSSLLFPRSYRGDPGERSEERGVRSEGAGRSNASHSSLLFPRSYRGAQGLAEDVRYYGQWMRDEAERRIGHLYPKVRAWLDPRSGRYFGEADVYEWQRSEQTGVRSESGEEAACACRHPSLSSLLSTLSSHELTVIAWLWARTVKSPNPAFADVDVPLASTFMLSTKAGNEAYVEVVRSEQREERERPYDSHSSLLSSQSSPYRFTVKVGKPKDAEAAKNGTKLSRGANFECLMSGTPIAGDYIKAEGKAGRMGARLIAIVAEGSRGRVYLAPTPEATAREAKPEWRPEGDVPARLTGGTCHTPLRTWGDLFTPRQLVALTTFSDLVGEAMQQVRRDALTAGLPDDPTPLHDGGSEAAAYAEAVPTFLGLAIRRFADRNNALCTWDSGPVGTRASTGGSARTASLRNLFVRQAIPMAWDYGEANPFSDSGGGYNSALEWIEPAVRYLIGEASGAAFAKSASTQAISESKVVSTDPPYYDNIGYADLSDFFYVWLRRSLRPVFPDLFATLAVPKAEELVATPYRHGSKEKAETFFLEGMTQAMHCLVEQAHPAFPVTIYYAFKQAETKGDAGTSSTGWETFLDAMMRSGFAINGTWPMRTELGNRMIGSGTNALASSIVLVCRKRPADAPTATRREFVAALKAELPAALRLLQGLPSKDLTPHPSPLVSRPGIAPVDLVQSWPEITRLAREAPRGASGTGDLFDDDGGR